MEDFKAIDQESLDYNNVGGKTLEDFINSKYDPQNYLGKGK
jgi:hypothetical protein